MTKKKMNYIDLLKEAVDTYGGREDTTKHLDVVGPFADDIISYRGDGELKYTATPASASSILERYYFEKDDVDDIETIEELDDVEPAGGQNVDKNKIIDKVVGESDETDDDETDDDDTDDDGEEISEVEKTIVEKLIAEMEDEDDDKDEDDDEDEKETVDEIHDVEPSGGQDKKNIEDKIVNEEEKEDLDVDDEVDDEEDLGKAVEEWGTGIMEQDKEEEEEEEEEDKKDVKEAGPVGDPIGKNSSSDDEDLTETFSIFKESIKKSKKKT